MTYPKRLHKLVYKLNQAPEGQELFNLLTEYLNCEDVNLVTAPDRLFTKVAFSRELALALEKFRTTEIV